MSKIKKNKKLSKTEIESNLLAENVRVLRCGLYGYVLNGKAILKSSALENVNLFSKQVQNSSYNYFQIKEAAKIWQKNEPLFIPNQLPNTKGERIVSGGNHYEAVVRQKY